MTMTQNELIHYGIPGMRWGRRSARSVSSTGGSRSSKSNQMDSGDGRKGMVVTKKKFKSKAQKRQESINNDLKSMNDKQLRDRINRMQMEQQYKKMMTPEKSAARKQVEQILINEGKQIAMQMARNEIKKAMSNK